MTPSNPTPQPLTMRELIERATSGLTFVHAQARDTTVGGFTPLCQDDGRPDAYFAYRIDAEYHARLSPDTLRAVCDALEAANKTFAYAEGAHGNDALFKIREALSFLNGSPAQRS